MISVIIYLSSRKIKHNSLNHCYIKYQKMERKDSKEKTGKEEKKDISL